MKKTFYHIGMLAVAALAFAGCAKEVDTRNEVRTHTVTFIAQSEETKTAIVEGQSSATYKWTTGDEQYLHITENGVAAESVSMALSSNNTVATITATFTTPPTTPNEYVYEAIYAKEVSKSSGNPLIQTTQEPASDSFDPSADIMIAEAVTSTTAVSPLSFCFRRVVSVNKMTLKGLVAGEKVSSVEISADKSLGGYYLVSGDGFQYSGTKLTLNYSNAEVGSDGQFPVYFVCAPQSEVKIGVRVVTDQNVYERDDFTKTVDFKVGLVKRFGVQLGTYGTPVQTGTPYSLVSSQTELVDGATYIIVGNNTTLVAMAGQNNNNRAKVDVTAENNVITIDNTIAAATFTIESVTDGYTIKDNESGLYLYAAGASSNNYLRSTDDPKATATWSITIDSGIASIVTDGASRGTMCYNSTNSIFSCYSALGSYKTLSLYIDASALIPTLATPTIVAGAAGKTITVIWEDVANADSYLVTCTGQTDKTVNPGVEQADFVVQADGTYTVTVTAVSNDHTAYLDSAPASETVTVGNPALGKPVISAFTQTATGFSATLSAAVANATSYDWNLYEGYVDDGNEVGDGSFDATSLTINVPFSDTGLTSFEQDETYLLVVTAKAAGYTSTASDPASFVAVATADLYDFSSIAGLNALVTSTSASYEGYLTNAVVSFVPATNTAIVKDATGSVMFYKKDIELLQGQTYTGAISVTAVKYNSLYSEVTAWDAIFSGSQATVAPQSLTLADLIGHYDEYQNAYVSVAGLTVSGIDGKNITVSDGTNSYIVFYNPGTPACAVGDVITAVGTITKYNTTEELKVWAAAGLTVTTHATSTTSTIAQVIAAASGAAVETSGVVAQVNLKGFIITDGNDNILVYQNATPSVVVGQAVTVSGTRGAYNGVAQISTPTITAGATGQTVTRTTLTTVTSSNATGYTTNQYVSLSGVLTISGNYYNISISGSSTKGSLYQVSSSATFTAGALSGLDGKSVTVTGYVTGSTTSYLNIAPVDIVLDYSPSLSISPATSSESPANWASGVGDAKTFTVTPTNGTWAITNNGVSSWASVTTSGNVITVTPNSAQASEAHSGTITVTLTPSQSGYSAIIETIYLSQAKYVAGTSQVTMQYTGSTTTNMTGNNDAATVGLDATKWSVVGAKGSASNFPGLNKDGTIRLYYHANGCNTITVSSTTGATIQSILITYGTLNNGKVLVGGNAVTPTNGSYVINSDSFVITNANTSNIQVHIQSIDITYSAQ